jgi:hypothetical protein
MLEPGAARDAVVAVRPLQVRDEPVHDEPVLRRARERPHQGEQGEHDQRTPANHRNHPPNASTLASTSHSAIIVNAPPRCATRGLKRITVPKIRERVSYARLSNGNALPLGGGGRPSGCA